MLNSKTALEQANEILSEWKKGSMDNRTGYHKLFKKLWSRTNGLLIVTV
jgi:hypothetical protein